MYKYFFKKGEKKRSTFIFIKKIVCVWMRVCVHIYTYLKKKKKRTRIGTTGRSSIYSAKQNQTKNKKEIQIRHFIDHWRENFLTSGRPLGIWRKRQIATGPPGT